MQGSEKDETDGSEEESASGGQNSREHTPTGSPSSSRDPSPQNSSSSRSSSRSRKNSSGSSSSRSSAKLSNGEDTMSEEDSRTRAIGKKLNTSQNKIKTAGGGK